MLRDYHSSYHWFFAYADTMTENDVADIIDWSVAFGVPRALMYDGPTLFRNVTVRLVAKVPRVLHQLTVPFCPWANGAV